MGYDVERFEGEVNKEFICPICAGVLEDAVITLECEHAFCRACILDWLSTKQQCPIDTSILKTDDLRSLPRILKNMLAELKISCEYASNGCHLFVRLDALGAHAENCVYNPMVKVPCEGKCGMVLYKREKDDHSCVEELRKCLDAMAYKLELETERNKKLSDLLVEMKSETKKEIDSLLQKITILQHEYSVLNKNWWQGLELIIGELYRSLVSQGPVWPKFGEFLKRYECPVHYWDSFEVCSCRLGAVHYCGLKNLLEFPKIHFRWSQDMGIWLILKAENTSIPNDLIPKSGFALLYRAGN